MNAAEVAALDRLPCGWLSLDTKGRVCACNATLCGLLDLTPEQLRGRDFDSLLTRPSRVLYQSHLQPLLRLHGHVEEFSLTFDLGAGQTLDALVYSTKSPADGAADDSEAALIELVVASLRKRRGIEDQMLRIKRAADHAPGMIFQLMLGADGRWHFPYTSEAIRRLYGVSSQEASESAETLFRLLSPETRDRLARGLQAASHAERDWHDVFQVQLPNSAPRWHEAHATPRRLANGVTLWHGHCADVTDRRALETAAADRQALATIHQAQSEFLARVSHELRTPLNGILGFTHLIANDKADNLSAEQRERLAVLTASGRHLLGLVNEVLEVTTIEAGRLTVELEPVALRPVLELALQTAQEQARISHVVVLPLECSADLWVHSNEQRLLQVLGNLLSNAIKYNRPAGTVQLQVRSDVAGVHVDVVDTGRGLSEAQRTALFQPFNRLGAERTAVQGHGLGLVITKQLLTLLGATLTVSSQMGRGSRFSVHLPAVESVVVAAPAQALPPPTTAPAAPGDATRAKVLYVEDDAVNGILMESILGMRPGIALRIATTGADACEMAQRQPPDVLLIDMHLPDTNGIALLATLRMAEGLAQVPAIMVSAGARRQDIDNALASGFSGYWTKPLDVDRTLNELDKLLGG